jgi:hypothetical protein
MGRFELYTPSSNDRVAAVPGAGDPYRLPDELAGPSGSAFFQAIFLPASPRQATGGHQSRRRANRAVDQVRALT